MLVWHSSLVIIFFATFWKQGRLEHFFAASSAQILGHYLSVSFISSIWKILTQPGNSPLWSENVIFLFLFFCINQKAFSRPKWFYKRFVDFYLQRHNLCTDKDAFNLKSQFGPAALVKVIKRINNLVFSSKRGCSILAKIWHFDTKHRRSVFHDFSIFIFFVIKKVHINFFEPQAFQNVFTSFDNAFHFFS